jgi:hypothetical protein
MTLQRRSLLPMQTPQPHVSEDAIAEVANRNGFQPVTVPKEAASAPTSSPRRQRQPTGRDHQFNVRLRSDTIDFIYAQANGRNVPIAQVVEEMVEALKRDQGRG